MQVRLLGAHQGASRDIAFMSLLVDGRLAIDAGGLISSLTLEEQEQIEAVMVTHKHYDHTKDLPGLAHSMWEIKSTVIYCIDDTRQALQDYYFNGVIWPKLITVPKGFYPLIFHKVEPEQPFSLLGYDVTPVTVSHSVPTVGYLIEKEGRRVFYTADTRAEEDPIWTNLRPHLLIIETTMSSEHEERAYAVGHLTPLSLERVLAIFHRKQGYYPKIVCVHMNPAHEGRIKVEVEALARKLGADITLGREGMVLEV